MNYAISILETIGNVIGIKTNKIGILRTYFVVFEIRRKTRL